MQLTSTAVTKVKEMAAKQNLDDYALRIMVVGGGCSGFSYDMDFADDRTPLDQVYDFEGLDVVVDPMSLQYLDGTTIDYKETFAMSGFTFSNPNATRTCGCGSSFAV